MADLIDFEKSSPVALTPVMQSTPENSLVLVVPGMRTPQVAHARGRWTWKCGIVMTFITLFGLGVALVTYFLGMDDDDNIVVAPPPPSTAPNGNMAAALDHLFAIP